MHREYLKAYSRNLGREMESLWFGKFGRPLIVFPPAGGRFFEFEDRGLVSMLADRVKAGEIQIVLIDGIDEESLLNVAAPPEERAALQMQFDAWLRHELVPYVYGRAQRGDLAMFGAGIGAYHAANFTGRYPEAVSHAVLVSGVFDNRPWLDDYWSTECYFHSPLCYVANMDGEWVERLSRVRWDLAAGEYDPRFHHSAEFVALLEEKGIPVNFEVWSGTDGSSMAQWGEYLARTLSHP